jgi:hypothetical protein
MHGESVFCPKWARANCAFRAFEPNSLFMNEIHAIRKSHKNITFVVFVDLPAHNACKSMNIKELQ